MNATRIAEGEDKPAVGTLKRENAMGELADNCGALSMGERVIEHNRTCVLDFSETLLYPAY